MGLAGLMKVKWEFLFVMIFLGGEVVYWCPTKRFAYDLENRMRKKVFGKTNLTVTPVAMGGIPITRLSKKEAVDVIRGVFAMGINFIDTANGYSDSEEMIGEALKGRKREDIVIASKSMAPDRKLFLKHVNLSLKRLQTDYIDIYQFHGVSSEEKMKKVMGPGGAYEGIEEAIKRGKVRYPGFSSHFMPVAKEMMLTGRFDVVQIPFNLIDVEAEKEIIPLARRMNLGFISMKPMGGGLLEDANLSFRYLAQFSDIVPDPGIEKVEEMQEILRVIEDPRPLSVKEEEEIEAIREELGKEFCHRCGYCQPCSQGISISSVLTLRSALRRMPWQNNFDWLDPAMQKARECTECEECLERCPYNLAIPELLKKNISLWDECKRRAAETHSKNIS